MQGTNRAIAAVTLALALLPAGVVLAQDDGKSFEGTVEMLWRNIDVNGNQDKYNEDFDGLSSGGRIGNLWLNFIDKEAKGLNYAQVQAQGLGGDPSEFANIRLGGTGKWDLRYNRRKQDYVYNLFDSMDDLDGHSWETRREIDEIDLRLYPTKNIDVVVGYSQNDRTGNSLFMKDVSRDLFRMNTPVDTTRRDLDVGLNWRIGNSVDVVFRQTRREYENSFVNTTEGDLGLDQGNATVLNDYLWNQQEDSTADLTQLNVHYGSRLVEVNFGYYGTLFDEEEFETRIVTQQEGTAFDTTPLDINGTSDTTTERDLQYFELDAAFYVTRYLNLVAEVSSMTWDQSSTGELDLSGNPTPTPVDTRWDYQIDTLTGFAEIVPTKRINVQLGVRTIDRELVREGFDAIGGERDGTFESDGDETFVGAVTWRSKYFHIAGDYEDGSVDRPLAPVSPFDTERFRVRAAVLPQPGMKIEATFLDYENENDFNPMLASNAAGKQSSLTFSNNTDRWNYFLRYSRQDVDTNARVNFDGAGFGATEDGLSTFTTDNEQFRTMIRYTGGTWSAFLRLWFAESDGGNFLLGDVSGAVSTVRIDQDYVDGELGLTYTFPSGVYLGGALRRFEYDDPGALARQPNPENAGRPLDYDGTIFTLRAGYVFGRPRS